MSYHGAGFPPDIMGYYGSPDHKRRVHEFDIYWRNLVTSGQMRIVPFEGPDPSCYESGSEIPTFRPELLRWENVNLPHGLVWSTRSPLDMPTEPLVNDGSRYWRQQLAKHPFLICNTDPDMRELRDRISEIAQRRCNPQFEQAMFLDGLRDMTAPVFRPLPPGIELLPYPTSPEEDARLIEEMDRREAAFEESHRPLHADRSREGDARFQAILEEVRAKNLAPAGLAKYYKIINEEPYE